MNSPRAAGNGRNWPGLGNYVAGANVAFPSPDNMDGRPGMGLRDRESTTAGHSVAYPFQQSADIFNSVSYHIMGNVVRRVAGTGTLLGNVTTGE